MDELRTIVYASTAHKWVNENALQDILEKARRFNAFHNITGALIYEDGNFLQTLEGSPSNIERVFQKIHFSQKHYDIQVMLDSPISHRSFPNWAMGFIEMPKDNSLRMSANQWKIYNSWPQSAPLHMGAKMIQNFCKRHHSISL